jgi:hypothetical protein
MPASLSTFTCWLTAGRLIGISSASSDTVHGPPDSLSMIEPRLAYPRSAYASNEQVTSKT